MRSFTLSRGPVEEEELGAMAPQSVEPSGFREEACIAD
jgi:hypothetical protein